MVKKETEKTAPVKAEEVKTEAKKPEVKAETKKAAVKKAEVKKAEVKKAEVKKAEVKKTVGRKPSAKKAAVGRKPSAKKAAEVKNEVYVQFNGKSLSQAELVKMAQDVWQYDMNMKAEDFKSVEIYVKPEENMAYFVVNGKFQGCFAL